MSTSSIGDKIPIQILHPNRPIFPIEPKVFGCVCFVHILGPNKDKLGPQAMKCVHIGYPKNQKGYRCFDPSSKREFVSADVTFFEFVPYFSPTGTSHPSNASSFTLPILIPVPQVSNSPTSSRYS
ncbi:hypothetical protein QML37_30440, partial [Klebsiella pneumoniae]|uniref:hypothetical protein n=1 Tax=Klebsiella pneumoniae TaxID=573 RepID=UPI003A80A7AE